MAGEYNYTRNEGSMTRMLEEMVAREEIPVRFNFEVQVRVRLHNGTKPCDVRRMAV